MYDSNIAAWVVSTITAVIAVGIIAPLLSIYTYGPHKSVYMSHPLPSLVEPAYTVIPMLT